MIVSRGSARAILGLLLLCVALRAVSLARPCLSDDEATYCVVAREMLSGHVLYRDVVDHKPPAIYVTYAAAQALGGPRGGMILLHALTILVVFATALLLRAIALRRRPGPGEGEGSALVAALLYVVFTTTLLDFDSLAANCELFMMLPLVGSVALYLDALPAETPGGARSDAPSVVCAWRLLLAGVLVGVAMLYKYQAGIQLPLYGLHYLWIRRGRRGRALAEITRVGVGAAAVIAGAAVVLAAYGGLHDALFWFRFNFAYIKEGLRPAEIAERTAVRVTFVVVSAALLYFVGVRAALRIAGRSVRRARDVTAFQVFLVGWLLASALAVSAGGRFFGHYFHQLTAPLALAAAPDVTALWRSGRRRLLVAGMAVPAAAFFLVGLFHGRVMALAGHPDPDYDAMASYLDARSSPRDGLAIWGNSPVLYFDADRPLGSRFVFSNYLTGLSPATRTQSDPGADASSNVVPGSLTMLLRDLATRKPLLFVDASPGNVAGYGKFPPSRYPPLAALLERDYEPIGVVGGAQVLRRKDAAVLGASR